jgi:serine/threonine protein kinase
MKIDYLSSDGIHRAEKAALERLRQEFNSSPFSQGWYGYAAFMMMDRVYRDREIDLILLTHDRLLVIELKNWNNGKITTTGDHWQLNGNDMGRSPVKVTADKAKILASKIKDKIKEPARSVWIDYRVVLCGNADPSDIPVDEQRWVMRLDQFARISTKGKYEQVFGRPRPVKASDYVSEFAPFFRGPLFKPASFSFNNFQIVGDVIFPHPSGLYKEYRALKRDDARHQALLRRWDFSVLAGVADTTDERATIALREHKALGYIHEQNEDLDAILLQPLSHPTRDDVDSDFCELYKLPTRQARLSEFVHRYGKELEPADRLALVKVLISHFADLHDINVAHRDIGDHSVWLERPTKVSISGLITSYFPEAGTVGGLRDALRAGSCALPEDVKGFGEGTPSDAFRRDVYLLGVVSHYLLFLSWPSKDAVFGVHEWKDVPDDPYGPEISSWLSRALDLIPSARYANAREMLNVLSRMRTTTISHRGLDFSAFEPFKTEILPYSTYRMEEELKRGHSHVYTSSQGGQKIVVKIWHQIRPDPKHVEEGHQILAFLERARLLKAQKCDVVPDLLDFGLSSAGPYTVQLWVPGTPLDTILKDGRLLEDAMKLCNRLIEATMHLHALQFDHGDLGPSNIIIDSERIQFIDLLDIFPGGGRKPYNPAYVPSEYESLPIIERDCYAVAKICEEIFTSSTPTTKDASGIYKEIQACLTREPGVYRLDRILDSIQKFLSPPQIARPTITIQTKEVKELCELVGDNGIYHVGVFEDKNRPGIGRVTVSGVRKQLILSIDIKSLSPVWIGVRDLPHSKFVFSAQKAIHSLKCSLRLVPGIDKVSEFVDMLLAIPAIWEALAELTESDVVVRPGPSITEAGVVPPTESIWKALIAAEEATLPEVEVAGSVSWEGSTLSRLRVPYSKAGEPLDYDSEDIIEILQEVDDELFRIGELNTRETTAAVLSIERLSLRRSLRLGEKLKLRSIEDLSSFRRRQSAVNRIVGRESLIPNLIDFFDPARCPEAVSNDDVISDSDLNTYDRHDGEKVEFSLNQQQREAFRTLWRSGPVGLLQGPPGTGKTAFIASFIHYALSRGAQSVLLASQSHEAVNNAAEKVLELSRKTNLRANLVRFGAEGMVSDRLRAYHSNSILQSYRELFLSEMRERIISLSENLGLPAGFVESWFDISYHLGRLYRDVVALSGKLQKEQEGSKEYKQLSARLTRREERFRTVAQEKFSCAENGDLSAIIPTLRNDLVKLHAIRSLDAIGRLDQAITIAQEWVDRLGTLHGNFEEFLAKTRSVVCGTCVGLGRSQFGIVKNRYDWVIVDEAARAAPGELAVAIQSGRRILLVGDHRQLPPLYSEDVVNNTASTLSYKERSVLTRSDFERAFESQYGTHVGAMLKTQYRMAPPIGNLVSHCFYSTPLESGRGDAPLWFASLPPCARAVVTWIDTSSAGRASLERKKAGTHSYENPYEIRELLDVLRQIFALSTFMENLVEDSPDDNQPIGIICAYSEQKHLLQREFSEQEWASNFRHLVKIDTVDSYQGKENRIIILSLTRNNDQFKQGFLESPQRANVSISRAMDRLVIVGAARMWREKNREFPFGKVLSYIESRIDGDNFALLSSPTVNLKRSDERG